MTKTDPTWNTDSDSDSVQWVWTQEPDEWVYPQQPRWWVYPQQLR
jgi:hypothetical protein